MAINFFCASARKEYFDLPFMNFAGASLLIVEDDTQLNGQLSHLLAERGHKITQCFDGSKGLLRAVSEKFDLILLDVSLPNKSGFDVLRSLRKSRWTPVILLTGRAAEQERIEGFRRGADDYVVKPFNLTELMLRIEAVLRRTCRNGDNRPDEVLLQLGSLRLNRQDLRVQVGDVDVELTPVQFKLLWCLASHQNEVLPKAYLHALVLEKPYCRHDRSIDMHLSRVRKKLEDAGLAADRLQTVHGRGYCFV